MPEQTFDTFVRPPPDLHKAASFFTWVTSKAPEKLASRKFAHRKLAEDYAPPAKGEEETALIGGFNQPLPQVLETILAMIENELKTALAYQVYAQTLHGLVRGDIAEEFLDHADQETAHAQYLMKRYSVLGGGPLNLPDVPAPAGSTDPIDIIQRMMRIEQEGAAKWRLLHSMIDESNPMRFKVEEYMTREEEHQDDLKRYLPPEPMTTPPTSLQAAAPPMEGPPAEGGAPKLASAKEEGRAQKAREAAIQTAVVGGVVHGLMGINAAPYRVGPDPKMQAAFATAQAVAGGLGLGIAGYMGAKSKTPGMAALSGILNPVRGATMSAAYGHLYASSDKKASAQTPAELAGSGGGAPAVPVTPTLAKAAPAKPLGAISGKPSILGKPIQAKSLGDFVKKAAGLDLGVPGDIAPSPSMPVQGDNGMSPGVSQSTSPVAGMPGLAEMEMQGQKEEDANAAAFFQQKAQEQQAQLEQAQQQLQQLQGQVQEKDQSLQQAQQLVQTQQQAAQMAHDTAARAMAAQVQSMQQVTQSQEQASQTMQGMESLRQNVLAAVNSAAPMGAPAGGGGETSAPSPQQATPGDPSQATPSGAQGGAPGAGEEQPTPIQAGGDKTAGAMDTIRQGASDFARGAAIPFRAAIDKNIKAPLNHLAQHPAAIAAPLGLTLYGAVDGYRKAKDPQTVEKAKAVTQAAEQQSKDEGTFAAALRLVKARQLEGMAESYAEHPAYGAIHGAGRGLVTGLAINRAADAGQRVYNRVKGML